MYELNEVTQQNTSVIICCAGMGTRLGIGSTKALVNIYDVPLIVRQLQLLQEYDDIRIVVGYQADRVIEVVNSYRKDIIYAFNYQYETTGVADSMRKGLLGAREYVIILDGDTLENPADFKKFLDCKQECAVLSELTSAEPVKATVDNGKLLQLSKTNGTLQWPGIVKIKRERITDTSPHVYHVLNEIMPLDYMMVRTREIDTPEDYEQAVEWFERGCQ